MASGPDAEVGGGGELRPLDWSHRIEEALDRNLFVLHGQRIVDVATGETMRHELFLRMVARQRLIPAGEFVMAAEEFGSIREIDHWVVRRAIDVAATGHPVDLNLSVRSTDEVMLRLIRDRLQETGAEPNDLVLEVNERQLVDAGDTGRMFIDAVHELGCLIALDGFVRGGPDSMLLRRFPISYIKLGHPFIEGLALDRGQRLRVASAALKAHRSGQKVIVQGVEDIATLEVLGDLGVDEAQGYALGPPESLDPVLGSRA